MKKTEIVLLVLASWAALIALGMLVDAYTKWATGMSWHLSLY